MRSSGMLTLFVGDITNDLCIAAQKYDLSAYLIDANNVNNKHSGTAYVSLGDLPSIGDFFRLLATASKIVYSPPLVWSDKKSSSQPYSMAWITEHYVRLVSTLYSIPVENVPTKITGVDNPKTRCTPDRQLWIAGCSTTAGSGVLENQRYQNIVKTSLGLEATDLSRPGSSIAWSRDQILKSDIKQDDIVVWGITTLSRFCWFDGVKINHVNAQYYSIDPIFDKTVPASVLDSPHRMYEALSAIQQVDNFCNKVGAHLILANLHGNLDIMPDCAKYKGFIMIHGTTDLDFSTSFLDLGSDNLHPGPKTHQHYAELILKKINDLKIGI